MARLPEDTREKVIAYLQQAGKREPAMQEMYSAAIARLNNGFLMQPKDLIRSLRVRTQNELKILGELEAQLEAATSSLA